MTKEQPDGFGAAYYLSANSDQNKPESAIYTNSWYKLYGTSTLGTNQWSHLVTTYDGAMLKLYVNGVLVSQTAQTGDIDVTDGVLHIGGNAAWAEFFKGYIDEIRIYNRALNISEIKTDMNQAIASSSASNLLLGEQTIGSSSDSIPQGKPMAFQTTARSEGVVTQLMIYVDSGSSCKKLVSGLYSDRNGAPYSLLATGTLNSPKAGNWNPVLVPATSVQENTGYWIAILSTDGTLKFRDKAGNTLQPSVKSNATGQTTLSSRWKIGSKSNVGPISAYGSGY